MFSTRRTPEADGDILKERQRLQNASAEMSRLQRELDQATSEVAGLREMNSVLSVAFRTSGHSALNNELEQLRGALNEERMRSVEARAEVLRYDEAEAHRRILEERRLREMQSQVSEASLLELDHARTVISGLRARIDDLEGALLRERQAVTRATAIVATRHETKATHEQRARIEELEGQLKERDQKVVDLARLVTTLQIALANSSNSNQTLNFLRSV